MNRIYFPYSYGNTRTDTNYKVLVILILYLSNIGTKTFIANTLYLIYLGFSDELLSSLNLTGGRIFKDINNLIILLNWRK
jgi:hypothetical protein